MKWTINAIVDNFGLFDTVELAEKYLTENGWKHISSISPEDISRLGIKGYYRFYLISKDGNYLRSCATIKDFRMPKDISELWSI